MSKLILSNESSNALASWSSDYDTFNNFSSPAVDSMKIRIPFDKVQVLDPRLQDFLILVNPNTGETVDENFKSNSLKIDEYGIKTRYCIEEQITGNQTIGRYLTILINSKLLKENYFSGITENTIKSVYEALMAHNVVSFSFNDLMDSEATDTDVKIDGIPPTPVIGIVNTLEANAIPRKKASQGLQSYKQQHNLGIQFAQRRTTSVNTFPFLKFYEKCRELKHNSGIFYKKYIKDNIKLPKELLRIETTIKNKKHFKSLGLSNNKLGNLLKNLKSVSLAALQKAFSVYVNPNITYNARLEFMGKMNINDRILIDYLITLCNKKNGYTFLTAVDYVLENLCNGKRERYNMKKRIAKLLDKDFEAPNNTDSFSRFTEFLKKAKTYV